MSTELSWEKNGTELVATGSTGNVYTVGGKDKKYTLTVGGVVLEPTYRKKTEAVAKAQELEDTEVVKAEADRVLKEQAAKDREVLKATGKAIKDKAAKGSTEPTPEPTVRDGSGLKKFVTGLHEDAGVPLPEHVTAGTVATWIEEFRDALKAKGFHATAAGVVGHIAHIGEYNGKAYKLAKELLRHQLNMEARATHPVTGVEATEKAAKLAKEPKPTPTGTGTARTIEVVNQFASTIPVVATEGKGGGKRFSVWGMPVTGLIRWMGSFGWSVKDARNALNAIGLTDVKEATLQAQIRSGKVGEDGPHGPIPVLTEEQASALNAAYDAGVAANPEPAAK